MRSPGTPIKKAPKRLSHSPHNNPRNHSHSIINGARKPAWLKGFSTIDISFTVAVYRQKAALSTGAGDGAIFGGIDGFDCIVNRLQSYIASPRPESTALHHLLRPCV